ncbi:VOC family protein [Liquorilactobacillus capillatus]|nr:VOC family protein [Liquorilactobacillus capillatus]
MNFKLKSLYLCVHDMQRAINFYEDLLQIKVFQASSVYSVFLVDDFRLGLFAFKLANERHQFGTNCVPSFSMPNKYLLKEKIKNLDVRFPLEKIDNNWVSEIEDSEGNRIEITAPV